MMDKELVTIATTNEVFEAEFLRNHLQNKGFEVYLADNHTIGVMNFLAPMLGGIKIRVPDSEAEEAKEFVETLRNAEIVYDEFEKDWME